MYVLLHIDIKYHNVFIINSNLKLNPSFVYIVIHSWYGKSTFATPEMNVDNQNFSREDYQKLADVDIELYDRISASIKQCRFVYGILRKQLGSIKVPEQTILALPNNMGIAKKFAMATCKKFTDVASAMKEIVTGEILIYLTEIHLYGVFTLDNYVRFISNIRDDDDETMAAGYKAKQVVLSGWPQRLVFVCRGGDDIVGKIRKYVKDCLQSDISIVKENEEIVISIQGNLHRNYSETVVAYQNLIEHINRVGGEDIIRDIKRHNNLCIGDSTYYACVLGDHGVISNVDDLKKILSSYHIENLTIQINNLMNNKGIVAFGDNIVANNNNLVNDPMILAENWIRLNPPDSSVKKSDYYRKYKDANANQIILGDSMFAKAVKGSGFTTKTIRGIGYWIGINKQ